MDSREAKQKLVRRLGTHKESKGTKLIPGTNWTKSI